MMLFLGVTSLLIVGSTAAYVPASKESKLAYATDDLTFELLRTQKNQGNVLISPFSIASALAMVYLGASGTTAEAMRRVLKYDEYKLSPQDVHDAFKSLLTELKRNNKDYQFSSVNGCLLAPNFKALEIYFQALEYYHSVDVENADFESKGELVRAKINDAVEKATKGKIKNFLEKPPNRNTKLFLLNVVYFLGNWIKPFDPEATFEGKFLNGGVKETKVQMMSRSSTYNYTVNKELDSTVVVLPYNGQKSMIIVLPDEQTGIYDLEKKISKELLDKALAEVFASRAHINLPKFHLESSTDLKEGLSRLGLQELFSDEANLSRIVGNQAGIKVSSFVHKVVIDVNEQGSEAAAASGVEFTPKSFPPVINVNHPFLFFIRDDNTGIILFSGRVFEL